ncbi:NfeD family protein [Azonexus hydrophilus]|jgi:membrane protein implicated in regulation of membrane protease activity|uniref:NfeD family protein n=1 Tax=Azonexus hydrophilus TaxID=418702 RepID=UPI00248FCBD2|nr:NfeD family protein [Azonexus hydrophilus]
MQPEWWHWIVGGVMLTLAELAIPAFYIIWFGLGALLVGVIVLLAPGLSGTAQISLWIIASLAMTVLWFRVFRQGFERTRSGTAGEVIGEAGLVVADIEPFAKGRVRFQRPLLGSDEWVCLADESIAAGERVRVVAVEGSFLKVTRTGV